MKIKIGKKTLKQLEGSTADDIRFLDIHSNEEYDFDEYMNLIKEE